MANIVCLQKCKLSIWIHIMRLHYHIFHCLILILHSTNILKNIEKTE